MILPEKHINLSESLFGLGGYLLNLLSKSKTVDMLWEEFCKDVEYKKFPTLHTFDNFILALDYLYILDCIYLEKGRIIKK